MPIALSRSSWEILYTNRFVQSAAVTLDSDKATFFIALGHCIWLHGRWLYDLLYALFKGPFLWSSLNLTTSKLPYLSYFQIAIMCGKKKRKKSKKWYVSSWSLTNTMHLCIDAIVQYGNNTIWTDSFVLHVMLYMSWNDYNALSGYSTRWIKNTIVFYVHHDIFIGHIG